MQIDRTFLRNPVNTDDWNHTKAPVETVQVTYTDFNQVFRQDNRSSDGSLSNVLILCLLDDEAWLVESHWMKLSANPTIEAEFLVRHIPLDRDKDTCLDNFRRRAIREYLEFTATDYDTASLPA